MNENRNDYSNNLEQELTSLKQETRQTINKAVTTSETNKEKNTKFQMVFLIITIVVVVFCIALFFVSPNATFYIALPAIALLVSLWIGYQNDSRIKWILVPICGLAEIIIIGILVGFGNLTAYIAIFFAVVAMIPSIIGVAVGNAFGKRK